MRLLVQYIIYDSIATYNILQIQSIADKSYKELKYNATTVAIQPIQNLVMSKLENTTKTSDYGKNVNLGYYFQHHNMEEIERTCRNQAISGYVYSDSLNRALKTNTSSVKKKKVDASKTI